MLNLGKEHSKLNKVPTVIVGMSGGVDSSVTALLLKQQGYKVIGMFMKNWEETDENGYCPAAEDFQDVIDTCTKIDIPYYAVNFSKEYWEKVFTHFVKEYEEGFTPNPDILCNREIKFKVFFEKALELGADYLATGHYCRTQKINEKACLMRGKDPGKDQSYFLYTLKEKILEKVLFPIGHLHKNEVRQIAEKYELPTAKKKDSTGICFIGKQDFRTFLSRYIAIKPGDMVTPKGRIVGRHQGIAFYTIGQRKGLAIGGPGQPWFVMGKDVQNNLLIVEQGEDHPALYHQKLIANEVSWVGCAPNFPYQCSAKIRYRHEDVPCTILYQKADHVEVHFVTPQKAVTPRQSIVFYQDEICLGGAIIHSPCH